MKHGDSRKNNRQHLYIVWCGMKQRCEDTNCRLYPGWGGRGIRVLWTRYEDFKRDMGPSFRDGLQIERIDNNGHYCKENCKWATAREQALNRRSNVVLTFNGKTQPMKLWAEELGLDYAMIQRRIKIGWSPEKALTEPKTGPMMIYFRGRTLALRTWAKLVGLDYRRIWHRINSGWTIERALTTIPYRRKADLYDRPLRQPADDGCALL